MTQPRGTQPGGKLPRWHEEAISDTHDCGKFDCGDRVRSDFLRRHAWQSHNFGGAKTFLAISDAQPARILGFYSLAPAVPAWSQFRGEWAELVRRDIPGFRLVRLATDSDFQGCGLGGQLLAAAARRCIRVAEETGGVILLIDAKNGRASNWFVSYGAMPLWETPRTLVMALETFARARTVKA